MKDTEFTKEQLGKVSEHRFYITMSLEQRLQVRDNMNELRHNYGLSMSEVLRHVMLNYMNDEEFLKYIDLPTGKNV